jgi:hypothetical protein
MLGRLGFVTLALATAVSRGMSAEVTIGGVSVSLPAPTGFCELTDRERLDKIVLTAMAERMSKAGAKLLGITADCQQLTDWRANKRTGLADMVEYWTMVNKMEQWTNASAVDAFCAVTRATDGKSLPSNEREIKTRFEQVATEGVIGVVAESPGICYTASLKLNSGDRGPTQQLTFHAYTVVRNRWITVTRIMPYLGADPATKSLAQSKADAAALFTANRN